MYMVGRGGKRYFSGRGFFFLWFLAFWLFPDLGFGRGPRESFFFFFLGGGESEVFGRDICVDSIFHLFVLFAAFFGISGRNQDEG